MLLEFFVRLDFAFSAQVCSLEKIFPPGQRPGTGGLGSVFWPAMRSLRNANDG